MLSYCLPLLTGSASAFSFLKQKDDEDEKGAALAAASERPEVVVLCPNDTQCCLHSSRVHIGCIFFQQSCTVAETC
jgi:hypothetical protein